MQLNQLSKDPVDGWPINSIRSSSGRKQFVIVTLPTSSRRVHSVQSKWLSFFPKNSTINPP